MNNQKQHALDALDKLTHSSTCDEYKTVRHFIETAQEQLDHMKNLYEAERVFHQKVTDALGDERAAHAKTRARLDTLLSGMVVLPEIVAPAEWEPVFFTNPDGIVNIGLSKGKFDVYGRLCVIGGHISDEKHPDYRKIINSNHAVEWCSVNNRDHHSNGWRKEWEPKE